VVRCSSLAILAVPLVGCLPSSPPATSPHSVDGERVTVAPLERYGGRNLRDLGPAEKERLEKLLAGCLPEAHRPGAPWAFEPWAVWRHPAGSGHILFQGKDLFVIPGESEAAVHFFDQAGRLVGSVAFSTGWRIGLTSANLHHEPALGGDVIEVCSGPAIGGADVARQFYGLFGSRVALLRLEDSAGAPAANDYRWPNHTIGPRVPMRTAEEWEAALLSGRPMEVLEALVWLGGEHRDPSADVAPGVHTERLEEARLVAAVRQRPSVRNAVRDLARSDSRWIEQAATLVLRKLGN
jgi:hypothetical protein